MRLIRVLAPDAFSTLSMCRKCINNTSFLTRQVRINMALSKTHHVPHWYLFPYTSRAHFRCVFCMRSLVHKKCAFYAPNRRAKNTMWTQPYGVFRHGRLPADALCCKSATQMSVCTCLKKCSHNRHLSPFHIKSATQITRADFIAELLSPLNSIEKIHNGESGL